MTALSEAIKEFGAELEKLKRSILISLAMIIFLCGFTLGILIEKIMG